MPRALVAPLAPPEARSKKSRPGPGPEVYKSRAIVYISHLPHGFYERELYKYLSQFGSVTNVRLGRSKRSGKSKGYAFVEFKFPEVAKIVCETMNNYLMFEKLVKCELVPAEKVERRRMFGRKINSNMPPKKKARLAAKKEVNKERSDEQNQKRRTKQLARLGKAQKRLSEAGVECAMSF